MEGTQDHDDRHSDNSDYMMEDHSPDENQYGSSDDDYERSSSRYYDEEGDGEDEDEVEEDAYIDDDDDDDNDVEEFVGGTGRSERSYTAHGILGSLAQSLNENAGEGGDRTRARQGHMNLSEVFPEILSILNDGGHGIGGGRGGRSERIYRLVNNVSNATEDPYMAMESLRELSEHLLMMDQVIIERMLPIEKLLASIVELLSNPLLKGELELQLLSCRCLYNLFEANPESISVAVDHNIITALQDILQEISYIDLAEQVLETLELISRVHARDILRSGGLSTSLQYLDFFTIHAQRKAVGIVSNACSRVQLEDFNIIKELSVILKPVFINAEDQIMLSKLVNALYGICGAFRHDYMLETLFTIDIVMRISQLIASSETQLDMKLKCLEIISVLVNVSGHISKEFIETGKVANMLSDSFSCYCKSSDAALHETLMFVPKPLLHSVARTIALLFPAEYEQILSIDIPKDAALKYDDEKLDKLLKELTPLMVEIYMNAVDFEVRRYVLIALARISTCLTKSTIKSVDSSIIRLVGSTLAQNESIIDKEQGQAWVASGLVVGVLSLIDILTMRFAPDVLPQLKREGIFSLLQTLNSTLQRIKDEDGETFDAESLDKSDDLISSGDPESNDEEGDEETELQFGLMDIPDQVEPKKIKFNVLRRLPFKYTCNKMSELSKDLLAMLEENEETVIEELRDIEELVKFLDAVDIKNFSADSWLQLWTSVKSCTFNGAFEISSFEFVSTGLAAALCRLVEKCGLMNIVAKRTFNEVFGPKIVDLIGILQTALTRLESFRIVECGLPGDEGRVASLGKQVKIKLVYNGDPRKDNISEQLTTITLSIHCISSFNALNEFLRHRIAQTRFLHSLFPGLSTPAGNETDGQTIDEVKNWAFEFSSEDEVFKLSDTIFEAMYTAFKNSGKPLSEVWHTPQVINFKRIDAHESGETKGFSSIYNHDQEFEGKCLKPAGDILILLKFMKVNQLPDDLFINPKLSAKLSRQLEEPLVVASGVLPNWSLQLTKDYFFLFPLETRLFFLQCTSFGYGRLVQLWKNKVGSTKESNTDDPLQHLGRITRHKLRVSRETLFLSGLKILDKYGSTASVLEIEYQGEVGTGLGPTLEFYACISREFTRRNLNMWRCENFKSSADVEVPDYVETSLFPTPLDPSKDNKRVIELFRYLGIFVARSMLDNRILDFYFSRVFFQLTHRRYRTKGKDILVEDIEGGLELLALVDEHLASSLCYLYENREKASELEQMTLTFTLPGLELDLIENGKDINVTSKNVEEYIKLVLNYTLDVGIRQQLDSFIEGFSVVFPYSSLLILTPEELVEMHGRVEEDWSSSTLYASINADHGYSMGSNSIHELVSIMSSFERQDRRLFLQFLTGSPKLPIGGFKSLKPRLTVVLKHPEDGLGPDAYLPSVMTCANYFKLPKYSSGEMMRSRIVQAMNEGSQAFLLS